MDFKSDRLPQLPQAVDGLTKAVDGWQQWNNNQFGTGMFKLPDPVVGFMRIMLLELDEIRLLIKELATHGK